MSGHIARFLVTAFIFIITALSIDYFFSFIVSVVILAVVVFTLGAIASRLTDDAIPRAPAFGVLLGCAIGLAL